MGVLVNRHDHRRRDGEKAEEAQRAQRTTGRFPNPPTLVHLPKSAPACRKQLSYPTPFFSGSAFAVETGDAACSPACIAASFYHGADRRRPRRDHALTERGKGVSPRSVKDANDGKHRKDEESIGKQLRTTEALERGQASKGRRTRDDRTRQRRSRSRPRAQEPNMRKPLRPNGRQGPANIRKSPRSESNAPREGGGPGNHGEKKAISNHSAFYPAGADDAQHDVRPDTTQSSPNRDPTRQRAAFAGAKETPASRKPRVNRRVERTLGIVLA